MKRTKKDLKRPIPLDSYRDSADWIKRVAGGKYQREELKIHEELERQYRREREGGE